MRLASAKTSAGMCRVISACRHLTDHSRRPFVLLTGTVIALILLVGGSVALLTSIGAQELPSTLTGGVAGGLKRE